jgi:hypothetical protein
MKSSFGFRVSDLGLSIVESLLMVAVVVNVASTLSAQDHRGSGMELTSFEFDVAIVGRPRWSGQNRAMPRSQREPLAALQAHLLRLESLIQLRNTCLAACVD